MVGYRKEKGKRVSTESILFALIDSPYMLSALTVLLSAFCSGE
jgi:hypothetical protein